MRNVGFTGSFVDDRLKNFCLVIERYSLTKAEVIFFKSCFHAYTAASGITYLKKFNIRYIGSCLAAAGRISS